MSIRTYNIVVLIVTLLGGLALAGVYAWSTSVKDRAVLKVNALELSGERLGALSQRIDVILTAADLAIGSGETYSANWASEQALAMKTDVESMAQGGHLLATYMDTRQLAASLNKFHELIDRGQTPSTLLINEFDAIAGSVIGTIIAADSSLLQAKQVQTAQAAKLSQQALYLQIGSTTLFVVLSLLLSRFGARLIVAPLENIQRASETEDPEILSPTAFQQAPAEIRSLAAALQTYLGHLWETVAARTHELERQRDDLEAEVTLRIAAEVELSNALRLAEEASQAKSAFLSITSHELRTPLNTVMATLTLLQEEPLSTEQLRYCELAMKASHNLSALLRDILDFSVADAGNLDIVTEPTDLPVFAREIIEHSTLLAQKSSITLKSHVDSDLPGHVLLDPHRVRQIIDNLVTNALKFSEGNPVVLKFTTRVLHSQTQHLLVSVVDQGPGIGEQEQQRIFDPFTQLDSSLARRGGGVGLGLALCRDLARAMGGECTVASRRGEGATFEFSLPVTAVEMNAPAANITKDPVGLELTHRLLLVEDSAVNQMLTQALLETLGHSVGLADDGYQAINLCSQEPFDVILMDLQMPGIDGLDTTRRIKGEAGPNQATPIIPLTANVGEEFHEKVKEVGMVGFIEKPIDRDQMAREIAAVMKASTNS